MYKCGRENCYGTPIPVWFTEPEYSKGYTTGRVRTAVSHLECNRCGKKVCVDGDYLAGEWRNDRSIKMY